MRREMTKHTTSTRGNTTAESMPIFRPSWSSWAGERPENREEEVTTWLTAPVRAGPTEQPMSPHTASTPNMAVPPLGKEAEVELSTPGHIRLTAKPHKAQQNRDTRGAGNREAPR